MTSCYTPDRIPGGVAESADAPDLKSGGRKVVWVRVPPPLLEQSSCKRVLFPTDVKEPPASKPGALAAMRQQ